ncbi:unnamed protein product [Cladocopium goreaui]|uniref:Copper-transporting ATPase 2 n=1 Tax=Cladocopium goreaui TaxID=2562237 RepID=A0A9P1DEE4_9DINO|nr:unnamed protein product [Cladocopium goreaui]
MTRVRHCLLSLVLLLGISIFCQTFAVRGRPPRQSRKGKGRLGGVEPRYYQQEAVNLFFQRARSIRNEKSRPMRLQLVGGAGKTHIYAMIVSRSLKEQPSSRVVIFVPWRPLAVQTCQKLRGCGFHTSMLGDGQNVIDPLASVVVCVYNSAPILRGQHFRVKIVDEAHHLQGDGFHTSLIRDGITADLEAEFTATFGGESSDDLDYLYSFQKAVHDGYVCDLNSYVLPLACNDQRMSKLAEFISLKSAEWSPMLILFNKLRNARAFAMKLREHQVRAAALAHRDPKTYREMCRKNLAEGSIQALCCVRLFNEGTDIPPLRTVVVADTRPKSDISILQAAMRSLRLHKNKADDTAQIVAVVNATGAVSTVTSRVKRTVRQLSALWEGMSTTRRQVEVADLEQMDSRSSLQLVNIHGEMFPPSNQNLWSLVEVERQTPIVNASRRHDFHRLKFELEPKVKVVTALSV